MEKKNNKKLFAIIGGSVLAFILTIALSVSITLAYFGDTAQGALTVNLDAAVEVGHSWTGGKTYETVVLPGEGVDVSAEATITAGASGAFLAAKVELSDDAATLLDGTTFSLNSGDTTWKEHSDGFWYYVGTGGTAPKQLKNAELVQSITGTLIISTGVTNETLDTATSFSVTVTFVAVQGVVFENGEPVAATLTNVAEMVKAVYDVDYPAAG